jgi:hypothetical protein
MMKEMTTSAPAHDVIERAKAFFAERVPHYGAYLEHEGPHHVTFRGQGGEEIAIAAREEATGTVVRASSPLYAQAIGRFFSTLPTLSYDRE